MFVCYGIDIMISIPESIANFDFENLVNFQQGVDAKFALNIINHTPKRG